MRILAITSKSFHDITIYFGIIVANAEMKLFQKFQKYIAGYSLVDGLDSLSLLLPDA